MEDEGVAVLRETGKTPETYKAKKEETLIMGWGKGHGSGVKAMLVAATFFNFVWSSHGCGNRVFGRHGD